MKTKLVPVLVCSLMLVGSSAPLLAGGFPASCAGTYLIEEAGGARDFWTLEADGSFFGTTSTQPLFNFSNQQGTWKKDGNRGAKGVLLAFVFDENNELLTVARIEISLHTVGDGCNMIAGSLEGRFFEDGEDPLDPSTDTGSPVFSDTFTGRRVR